MDIRYVERCRSSPPRSASAPEAETRALLLSTAPVLTVREVKGAQNPGIFRLLLFFFKPLKQRPALAGLGSQRTAATVSVGSCQEEA